MEPNWSPHLATRAQPNTHPTPVLADLVPFVRGWCLHPSLENPSFTPTDFPPSADHPLDIPQRTSLTTSSISSRDVPEHPAHLLAAFSPSSPRHPTARSETQPRSVDASTSRSVIAPSPSALPPSPQPSPAARRAREGPVSEETARYSLGAALSQRDSVPPIP
jgi:hypothetical protein